MYKAHALGLLRLNRQGNYELVSIGVYSEGPSTITHYGHSELYTEFYVAEAETFSEATKIAQDTMGLWHPRLSHLFNWKR